MHVMQCEAAASSIALIVVYHWNEWCVQCYWGPYRNMLSIGLILELIGKEQGKEERSEYGYGK